MTEPLEGVEAIRPDVDPAEREVALREFLGGGIAATRGANEQYRGTVSRMRTDAATFAEMMQAEGVLADIGATRDARVSYWAISRPGTRLDGTEWTGHPNELSREYTDYAVAVSTDGIIRRVELGDRRRGFRPRLSGPIADDELFAREIADSPEGCSGIYDTWLSALRNAAATYSREG